MGRYIVVVGFCVVSFATLIVAGCASAPGSPESATATPLAADSSVAAELSAVDRREGELVPDATVDARDPNPGSTVTCREMLKQGSNVIIKQCMTQDDWKTFERLQEQDAKAVLRTLQGGAYR
jgi:hypothetical protein